ncbi:MAG: type II toxin-antitoxin system RelE family toxin [Candidatus Levyibacteriota bacterium]
MKIIITPKTQKHYARLPKTQQIKIKKKISLLERDPLSGKKLEGEYAELRTIRAWPYRIFYFINEKEESVYIAAILHRQGAYK